MGNVLRSLRNYLNQSSGHSKEVFSIQEQSNPTNQLVYSWDKKCEIEASQFRLHHLVHQNIHRPLVVQGQQLTVESCSRSLVTVSGYSDSVFIDDCCECKIILGPVKGSVFLRNCQDCVVVLACGQFRTRDCTNIACYLFCPSQPSLETSTSFWFHCLSLDYPQFREQMNEAGLNPMSLNRWAEVFDFSSSSLSSNWRLLDVENRLEDHLTEQELEHCINFNMTFERAVSAVPFSHPALKQSVGDNLLASASADISDRFYSLVGNTHAF